MLERRPCLAEPWQLSYPAVFAADGAIWMLTTQDCSRTYDGALRPLWFDRLDETGVKATAGAPLDVPASAGRYREGSHTLSSGGGVTFIDVKYIDRSLAGSWLELTRRFR